MKAKGHSIEISGFSLLEICIVIALATIIVFFSISGFLRLLDNAKGVQCITNLKQISGVLMTYTYEHNGALIPGAVVNNGKNIYWYHVLEPYLGDPNLNPNSSNRPVWQQCPSKNFATLTRETVGYGWNYINFGYYDSTNVNELGPYGWASRLLEVSKPSHTIILGDSQDDTTNPANNYQHRYLYVNDIIYNPNKPRFARRHQKRGNYLMLDGHIESLTPEQLVADPKIFKKVQ